MHNAGRVGGPERPGDLHGVLQRLGDRERLLVEEFCQGLALYELHRDEVHAPVGVDVVDGDDARVVQRGGCAGFAREALPPLGVGGGAGRQHLEGDRPVEVQVMGPVDDAHAPGAEFVRDAIVAQRLAKHDHHPQRSRDGPTRHRTGVGRLDSLPQDPALGISPGVPVHAETEALRSQGRETRVESAALTNCPGRASGRAAGTERHSVAAGLAAGGSRCSRPAPSPRLLRTSSAGSRPIAQGIARPDPPDDRAGARGVRAPRRRRAGRVGKPFALLRGVRAVDAADPRGSGSCARRGQAGREHAARRAR